MFVQQKTFPKGNPSPAFLVAQATVTFRWHRNKFQKLVLPFPIAVFIQILGSHMHFEAALHSPADWKRQWAFVRRCALANPIAGQEALPRATKANQFAGPTVKRISQKLQPLAAGQLEN